MPWKLYIDSRKRVAGASGDTDTAFTVQLPRPITVSGKAYIDVVLCPNSWYLIRAGETNRLYISETQNDVKRVVFLAPGQYQSVHDLATACQFALNQNKGIPGTYVCQYKKELNRMCIGITGSTTTSDKFLIWSDKDVAGAITSWVGVSNFTGPYWGTASATDMQSANRAMGFMKPGILTGTFSADVTAPNACNVQPYTQLFIRSNLGGGSAESLGVNGEPDIVRRIVIGSTPLNDTVYDIHSQAHDHVQISGVREFNNFWFEIIDINGRIVDSHGLPISFSIIFEDMTL